jgi:hypothetical protein
MPGTNHVTNNTKAFIFAPQMHAPAAELSLSRVQTIPGKGCLWSLASMARWRRGSTRLGGLERLNLTMVNLAIVEKFLWPLWFMRKTAFHSLLATADEVIE